MLRKILVIVQYIISVIIIICTIMLIRQMNYIRNRDLGFNKDNIFFIGIYEEEQKKMLPILKQTLSKYSGISSVASSDGMVSRIYVTETCKIEDSKGEFAEKNVSFLGIDFNFLNLMEMKVLEGRSFSREIESDRTEAVIVNETLVKEMGWTDSPIGKRIELDHIYRVVGVLKDFHYLALHYQVAPAVIIAKSEAPRMMTVLSIKIRPGNTEKTIKFINEKLIELMPMLNPPEISSLEDTINSQYRTDEAWTRIFICSAFLGIFISCLGLLGVSSFVAESRTKEIGVRKVFGASVGSIVSKLSLNFLALVLIASIIACPIAYYIMGRWLDNFAYKTEMSWWLFVTAVGLAMVIALATVSYHAVKAALTDPVKALRYE